MTVSTKAQLILSRRELLASMAMLLPGAAIAQTEARSLAVPKGDAALKITGNIANANQDQSAVFDMAQLETFEQHSITAKTPWFDVPTTFTGPLFSAVLAAAGARGSKMKLYALDDYSIDIPVAEAKDLAIILAIKVNGKAMEIEDHGPVWLMYPFDRPDIATEANFAKCVWQLVKIDVT